MSIMSAIDAEHHNNILKEKSEVLLKAIQLKDWTAVEYIYKWLNSAPFSE